MADNVGYTEGSGRAIATDEVGGVDYQLVKLVNATADSTTRTGVAADPLVVGDGGGSLTVDAASLPLPTGAATAAKQPAIGTAGSASTDVLTVQGAASMTALTVGDGGGSLTVDASSLPLPTGASTAAKQPALGTAGSASSDVLTVQGVASMTALTVGGVAAHDAAVSGSPVLAAGRASTVAPTAVSADGDVVYLWLTQRGAVVTTGIIGLTSTLSNVAASASSVNLLASNTARRSVTIVNDSASICRVKEGATASATSFSWLLQPYDTLVLGSEHSGAIDAIWDTATGSARITERA